LAKCESVSVILRGKTRKVEVVRMKTSAEEEKTIRGGRREVEGKQDRREAIDQHKA
jgi:hypothetical protein